MSLIINFVPVITVFLSLKHSCFQIGARARATMLLSLAPGGLVARTLDFHPGYPGLITRKGTPPFRTTHVSSGSPSEINPSFKLLLLQVFPVSIKWGQYFLKLC